MNLKKPKYKSLKIISIQDYLNLIEDLELNGEKISRRKKEWRLLIENNKLVCPFSNKRVAYCSYDFNEPAQTYHWNFYSEDDQLFTIDHIVARSKGGNSCEIDNLQPMLYDYNFQKGAKNMTEFRKEISKTQLEDYYDDILDIVNDSRKRLQIIIQDGMVIQSLNLKREKSYSLITFSSVLGFERHIQINISICPPNQNAMSRCIYCGLIPDKLFLDMILKNTFGTNQLY